MSVLSSRLADELMCGIHDALELPIAPVVKSVPACACFQFRLTIFFTLRPDFAKMSFITPPNLAG